jgi:hypothetical protein
MVNTLCDDSGWAGKGTWPSVGHELRSTTMSGPDEEPATGAGGAKAARHPLEQLGPGEADVRAILTSPPDALPPALRPVRELLDACRDDPARFNAEVLGRTLWSKQIEVCTAVASRPVTLVPAGRAVGKSFLLAGLVLWWLYTRPGALVITTGPDFRQVVAVLWKEIRRALRPRLEPGGRRGPRLILGHDHLSEGYASPQRLVLDQQTDWQALGFAAQSEEGFSGHHSG